MHRDIPDFTKAPNNQTEVQERERAGELTRHKRLLRALNYFSLEQLCKVLEECEPEAA